MAGIYVFSERKDTAACLLTAARQFGTEVTAFALDKDMAEELLSYGPDKVLVIRDAVRPESYAKAVAALLKEKDADLFMVGASATGRELAASVAAYAGAGMVSDAGKITKEDGAYVADLVTYSGIVSQREKFIGLGVVTTGRGIATAETTDAKGVIEEIGLEADTRVAQVKVSDIEKSSTDLAAAEKIVSIGMGTEETDIPVAREIADLIGGELSCSRDVAEQRHWLPLDQYVGISGVTVKPKLYLALAISGQMQHIFGMRDSKIIAAINKDESARIFENADYGIVGDIHDILPVLIEKLKARA